LLLVGGAQSLLPVNEDLGPARTAVIDGARVVTRTGLGEQQMMYDLSRLRWREVGEAFAFAPVTAGDSGLASWATIVVAEDENGALQWPFHLVVSKWEATTEGRERAFPQRKGRCGENFAWNPENAAAKAHDVGFGNLVAWLEAPTADLSTFTAAPPYRLRLGRWKDDASDVLEGKREVSQPEVACVSLGDPSFPASIVSDQAGPAVALARDAAAGVWVEFESDKTTREAALTAYGCGTSGEESYVGKPVYSKVDAAGVTTPVRAGANHLARSVSVGHVTVTNGRVAHVLLEEGCQRHSDVRLKLWRIDVPNSGSPTTQDELLVDPVDGHVTGSVTLTESSFAIVDNVPWLLFGARCNGGCTPAVDGLYVCPLREKGGKWVCAQPPASLKLPGASRLSSGSLSAEGKAVFLSDEADLAAVIVYDVRSRSRPV
ncbi:MAG: hypothetical protein ACO3JL_21110, partial [Myxococcota bacterium]